LRLKLWDPEKSRLVSFRECLRRKPVAPAAA
jgi:hypothetical protein